MTVEEKRNLVEEKRNLLGQKEKKERKKKKVYYHLVSCGMQLPLGN